MKLAILLHGNVIAQVEPGRNSLFELTYRVDQITPSSTPLSVALPLSGQRFTGKKVATFLWGLLPENASARQAAARLYGADVNDPLSLLAEIGRDCAGAIQVCPFDEVPDVAAGTGELELASDAAIEQRLAELKIGGEPSWVARGEHWSLPGMQEKFGIRWENDQWWWARGAQPTTHIIKPGVRDVRHQAFIEHVSMRAAALLDLNVARTQFADFLSECAIVVERFDRVQARTDRIVRQHQEDVCQALATSAKYEVDGGPSALKIVQFLRDASSSPASARANVAAFVDGLIYNTVIAAPDGHARNYSVFLNGDDVEFAPLYDVATGLAYDTEDGERRPLAMSINDEFDANLIGRGHWQEFAVRARLNPNDVTERVLGIVNGAEAAFDRALAESARDDWDGQVADLTNRLRPYLRKHLASLRQRIE